MEGTGRMVGEDVETVWAGTNPLAPSIREMGPAAQHDTLNDHWNGWNFRKIVRFRAFFIAFIYLSFPYQYLIPGTSLLRRFNEAVEMSTKQTKIFYKLSATFSPEIIDKWEAMVANWNADPKAPNPYREPESRKSPLSEISSFFVTIIR